MASRKERAAWKAEVTWDQERLVADQNKEDTEAHDWRGGGSAGLQKDAAELPGDLANWGRSVDLYGGILASSWDVRAKCLCVGYKRFVRSLRSKQAGHLCGYWPWGAWSCRIRRPSDCRRYGQSFRTNNSVYDGPEGYVLKHHKHE